MTASDDEWIPVALLLRPQGRRGELLAEPQTDAAVFSPGRIFRVVASSNAPSSGASLERVLERAWQPTGRNAGRLVLELQGVESINEAEALAGHVLVLRLDDLPALDEDTFRVRDLVGCALWDGEVPRGTVAEVQFPVAADGRTRLADAPDLLAVQPVTAKGGDEEDREPVLVPFVRAWLLEVDLPARRIRMQLPPGLFDRLDEEA